MNGALGSGLFGFGSIQAQQAQLGQAGLFNMFNMPEQQARGAHYKREPSMVEGRPAGREVLVVAKVSRSRRQLTPWSGALALRWY